LIVKDERIDVKTTRSMAVAVLIVGTGLALQLAQGQQPRFNRTDLRQHDLSISGSEVIPVSVELAPGVASPKHTHPGERSSMSSKTRWSMRSKASRR
jgi:hypothetical protein